MTVATFTCETSEKIISAWEIADQSKSNFLNFIETCGIAQEKKVYKHADFLVKDISDINEWLVFLDGDMDKMDDANYAFRTNRIEKINLSLEDFVNICSNNLKDGMELFFQYECAPHIESRLAKKIESGELTFEFIYNKSKEDNWYNTAWNFASSNWLVQHEYDRKGQRVLN